MSQVRSQATVALVLHEEEPDPEELEELTAKLRRRLLELDVDAVDRTASGEAPAGARGIGAALGPLIVQFLASKESLGAMVATIRGWLSGRDDRTVKIAMDGDTLELTGVSAEGQEQLVAAWIARHAKAD